MMMRADVVAAYALRALARGDAVAVPGRPNRIAAPAPRLLPRRWVTPLALEARDARRPGRPGQGRVRESLRPAQRAGRMDWGSFPPTPHVPACPTFLFLTCT